MSPRTNARGRATARAIESAAVRLASEHGAAALTVDQICEAAGIKQRTFFNHFAAKEDALLGSALPVINEQRTREYLSDSSIGVLSGALELIDPPRPAEGDEMIAAKRMQVLASSPALAERQAGRLMPLADEMRSIIRLKLAALGPDLPDDHLDDAALCITQIVSALALQPRLPECSSTPLKSLEWVWDRLL